MAERFFDEGICQVRLEFPHTLSHASNHFLLWQDGALHKPLPPPIGATARYEALSRSRPLPPGVGATVETLLSEGKPANAGKSSEARLAISRPGELRGALPAFPGVSPIRRKVSRVLKPGGVLTGMTIALAHGHPREDAVMDQAPGVRWTEACERAWKMFTRSEGKVAVDMGTGL